MPTAFTVGHSTREPDELLALLRAAGVRRVADVRTVPRSRRVPHMAGEQLARWLPEAGVDYVHLRDLGGWRRPRPGSPNRGWRVTSFQGYADHLATPACRAALAELERLAAERPTAAMCAEVDWHRCHRRLVADALVARGWRVLHLGLGRAAQEHTLTPFAVVGPDGSLTYPPAQGALGV